MIVLQMLNMFVAGDRRGPAAAGLGGAAGRQRAHLLRQPHRALHAMGAAHLHVSILIYPIPTSSSGD